MKAQLKSFLRGILPREARNWLKSWHRDLTRMSAPAIRAVYGTFGPDDLLANLQNHLPRDFDILMVHSSMDQLYPTFTGNAFEVLSVLKKLAGDRTLVMPAFVLGVESFEPARRYRTDPVFDVKKTPSETGFVTELFRRSRNVRRSLHPTHSLCASGPLAEVLTADHHKAATTFGAGTPYDLMNRYRTIILGVGTHYYDSLTHILNAEDLLGSGFPDRPAVLLETATTLVTADGESIPYTLRTVPLEAYGQLRMERLKPMMKPGELQEWRFHGAPFFVVEAAAVTRALVENARRGKSLYDSR